MDDNVETINDLYKDSGLAAITLIARYYGIAVDETKLIHEFNLSNRHADIPVLLRIAKSLKLKARCVDVSFEDFSKITYPGIVELKDFGFSVIFGVEKEKCIVAVNGETAPVILEQEEFEKQYKGRIILITQRNLVDRELAFGLRWFIPTIVKYKRPLLEVLLAAFVTQMLGLFSPMITQSVIDKVLTHNSYNTLNVLAIGLVIITVFECVLSVARSYVFAHTTSKIDVILGCRLFDHLFKLPFRYFESRRVGDTIARVRELENIRRFLTGVPLNTLLDAVFIIVYIVVMYFYSVTLTNVTLISLPILAIITAIVTPLLKERLDEKFKTGADQQSYLVEAVGGVQTIKSFAVEPSIQQKWEGLLADYTTASFRTSMLGSVSGSIAQFVQKSFDILILYLGAKLVMVGNLTIGQMVAFRMLAGHVSQPVMRLVQMWQEFQQTSLSIKRLGDIFNTRPERNGVKTNSNLPTLKGDIIFDKVCFRYDPAGSQVIKNMTFRIPSGRVIGVVGRSGSGKSTISKLIQRLYVPESGKITIDGMDISLADPYMLRKQIGIVLQESFLFNASIRDNIALQNPAATIEQIIHVSKIAGAHDFISELPEGYDTMVGERGTGLSGGQKQRIAIARALLMNPKILIFDEATSALDYESERIIQKNLKEICRGRTVIIIAHRLSTLKDADAIMVVEKGNIVEYGPQQKLIQSRGLYYRLLQQQQMN
ncbi:MAG: type I secretion system permease/ATPase [Lachnospiraceae bacterium]|nr:type I secretion system permease/ATPase [Lachnospiraceae bacterium]